jgi:acyl-coenzyme A thioesterase PaaI-like protein
MAAAPAIPTINGMITPPTDAETLALYHPDPNSSEADIDSHILNHPFVKSLFADPELRPARPHLKIPAPMRPGNLTAGTLMGESKLTVPPLSFSAADGSRFYSIAHLGPGLCGHPGVIHGGLLATLLDEGLARCCFPALPNKVGVTASLKIEYKKPVPEGAFVILKAETTKVEGRKAWVKGRLEMLDDQTVEGDGDGERVVYAEAEALFIEPRQAKTMARVYSTS